MSKKREAKKGCIFPFVQAKDQEETLVGVRLGDRFVPFDVDEEVSFVMIDTTKKNRISSDKGGPVEGTIYNVSSIPLVGFIQLTLDRDPELPPLVSFVIKTEERIAFNSDATPEVKSDIILPGVH